MCLSEKSRKYFRERLCSGEWLAALLTLLWVILVIFILVVRWRELLELKLNELGDLLAGVFGPAAFLWLILGYRQQGLELKNSSEALKHQVIELQRSFHLQKEVAWKNDRALDPILSMEYLGSNWDNSGLSFLSIINTGVRCESTRIKVVGREVSEEWPAADIPRLLEGNVYHFCLGGALLMNLPVFVNVEFYRLNGSRGVVTFCLNDSGDGMILIRQMPDMSVPG